MTDRNLPNDFARCADGQYGCPRVETCARMIKPPNVPLAAFVDFWVATSFMGDDECGYYIKRDALISTTVD